MRLGCFRQKSARRELIDQRRRSGIAIILFWRKRGLKARDPHERDCAKIPSWRASGACFRRCAKERRQKEPDRQVIAAASGRKSGNRMISRFVYV